MTHLRELHLHQKSWRRGYRWKRVAAEETRLAARNELEVSLQTTGRNNHKEPPKIWKTNISGKSLRRAERYKMQRRETT